MEALDKNRSPVRIKKSFARSIVSANQTNHYVYVETKVIPPPTISFLVTFCHCPFHDNSWDKTA